MNARLFLDETPYPIRKFHPYVVAFIYYHGNQVGAAFNHSQTHYIPKASFGAQTDKFDSNVRVDRGRAVVETLPCGDPYSHCVV